MALVEWVSEWVQNPANENLVIGIIVIVVGGMLRGLWFLFKQIEIPGIIEKKDPNAEYNKWKKKNK